MDIKALFNSLEEIKDNTLTAHKSSEESDSGLLQFTGQAFQYTALLTSALTEIALILIKDITELKKEVKELKSIKNNKEG